MSETHSGGNGAPQGGPIEQLIYASVSTPRVTSALQMSDILAVARPNNARDGITGALTAVDGRFIQIIEGPTEALDDLMIRLNADERHKAIEILARRGVPSRAFAVWDMVSPRLVFEEVAALGGLLGDVDATLDAYIRVFSGALERQERLLAAGHDAGESRATVSGQPAPPQQASADPEV